MLNPTLGNFWGKWFGDLSFLSSHIKVLSSFLLDSLDWLWIKSCQSFGSSIHQELLETTLGSYIEKFHCQALLSNLKVRIPMTKEIMLIGVSDILAGSSDRRLYCWGSLRVHIRP